MRHQQPPTRSGQKLLVQRTEHQRRRLQRTTARHDHNPAPRAHRCAPTGSASKANSGAHSSQINKLSSR